MAASDPEISLLYRLFCLHHWGLADLKALYEGRDGWQVLIRAFAAHEAERRAAGFLF